ASAIEHKRQESALRDNERRYRQMFENNRAVQLIIDPESGRIIDANAAAAEFYGWSVERLRSMRLWDINVLGEQSIREEMMSAVGQSRVYFQFKHRVANGNIRDVEVHSGPVEISGRRYLYSIIHDVTERREAEQALQASEEKYRNIFNYASVGIFQSMRDGTLTTANAALARMLGYDSVEELLPINLHRDIYFRPEDRGSSLAEAQVLWKKKNGAPIWVQINEHAIRSADGQELFEGFVYDITERKFAEQQVAAANAQRKAVLDAATGVPIIATDAEGTITVFNSGAERMLGYAASEVIG